MSQTGAVMSVRGCALDYRWYRPASARSGDLVVLGHGFLRSKEHLDGLARALAAAGMASVTFDFCASRPWSGNPFSGGLDMIRVADALDARRVVYAGFSAGALSALVAARNDPRALGVVTLDLVDAQRLGVLMASGLERPLIGLIGEPSACNAHNNGLLALNAGRRGRVERFPGADHCDFESPSDWLCHWLCRRGGDGAASPRWAIEQRAVAHIRALLSHDTGGP